MHIELLTRKRASPLLLKQLQQLRQSTFDSFRHSCDKDGTDLQLILSIIHNIICIEAN